MVVLIVALVIARQLASPSSNPFTLGQLDRGTVVGFEDKENTFAWKAIVQSANKLSLDLPVRGLAMIEDLLTVSELKRRLLGDARITKAQERGELYVQLFY